MNLVVFNKGKLLKLLALVANKSNFTYSNHEDHQDLQDFKADPHIISTASSRQSDSQHKVDLIPESTSNHHRSAHLQAGASARPRALKQCNLF